MKFKVVKSIKREGYPTSQKDYSEAHSEASNAEKKKYPKGYQESKKIDKKVSKDTLIGTHSKSGKIEVSKIVPNKLRNEVAFHEKEEQKAQNRLKKERKFK